MRWLSTVTATSLVAMAIAIGCSSSATAPASATCDTWCTQLGNAHCSIAADATSCQVVCRTTRASCPEAFDALVGCTVRKGNFGCDGATPTYQGCADERSAFEHCGACVSLCNTLALDVCGVSVETCVRRCSARDGCSIARDALTACIMADPRRPTTSCENGALAPNAPDCATQQAVAFACDPAPYGAVAEPDASPNAPAPSIAPTPSTTAPVRHPW